MKRFFATIVMVLGFMVTAGAMSYSQAREQALFLTDKMAYELNLTDDQYEAAYEINLDYLLSVNSYDELYGDYWRWRNLDFSYVLLDWQYRMFCDAAYFYRPLYFNAGCWHFAIYARYPHRDYFYFHRPTVYVSYRGGHSWRQNNGRSWYSGRTFGSRRGDNYFGMRDGFQRGDYGRGNRQSFGVRGNRQVEQKSNNSGFGSRRDVNSSFGSGSRRNISGVASGSSRDVNSSFGSGSRRDGNSSFGSSRGNSGFGSRESSTRTTVRQSDNGSSSSSRSFGSGRSNRSFGSPMQSTPRSTFKPVDSSSRGSSMSFGSSKSSSSFGSSRSSSSFGSSRSSGSSFGSSRSSSPSRSSSSFGGGSSSRGSSSSRGGGFGSRR